MMSMSRQMTVVILAGLALGLAVAVTFPVAQAQTVNLLCSVEPEHCEALAQSYSAETGVNVEWLRMSTAEALARLRAEASAPLFDVWYGGTGDPHLIASRDGLTEVVRPAAWDDILPGLRSAVGDFYIPAYVNPVALIINEGILEERGAPVPRSWEDLTDPALTGLIGMPDPNTSGTGYSVIATLVQIYGEDEAFDLLGRIHQNIAEYTRSGSAPATMTARGELGVAIGFMGMGLRSANEGYPVTIIVPEDGVGMEIGGLSLVKNAPNPDAARDLLEWLITPDAQAIGAQVGSFQVPSNMNTPMDPNVPDLDTINLIDYDFEHYGQTEVRQELIGYWTNNIYPIPRR